MSDGRAKKKIKKGGWGRWVMSVCAGVVCRCGVHGMARDGGVKDLDLF